MSELRTLVPIRTPPTPPLLTWVVKTEEGQTFEVRGTTVVTGEDTRALTIYEKNDVVFFNQDVSSVIIKDAQRVVDITPPKKLRAPRNTTIVKKKKKVSNG